MSFAADIPQQQPVFFENSFDTMQLINRLRAGDEGAIETVRRIYQRLEAQHSDEGARRYAEFRALEYLRSAILKAGTKCEER